RLPDGIETDDLLRTADEDTIRRGEVDRPGRQLHERRIVVDLDFAFRCPREAQKKCDDDGEEKKSGFDERVHSADACACCKRRSRRFQYHCVTVQAITTSSEITWSQSSTRLRNDAPMTTAFALSPAGELKMVERILRISLKGFESIR